MGRTTGRSANDDRARRALYRQRFVRKVHELLEAGTARAGMGRYYDKAEPEITGLLVTAIRATIEDIASPPWMSHFAIHDDPPVRSRGRLGKKRPRVDIEFERTQQGRHPRFQFEAKRLRSTASARAYLGPSGLGCFLSGRYGRELEDVGMLGYVQRGDQATWAQTIAALLASEPRRYFMRRDGRWQQVPLAPQLRHTYSSKHTRSSPKTPITIYHSLLLCV